MGAAQRQGSGHVMSGFVSLGRELGFYRKGGGAAAEQGRDLPQTHHLTVKSRLPWNLHPRVPSR